MNPEELERLARAHLSGPVFDFIAGGSWAGETLAENRRSFSRYRIVPRVLVDVSSVSLSTSLLGTAVDMPIGLAPTSRNTLVHADGELAVAQAASEAKVLFCLSSFSSRSIEEVAATSSGPKWFQLYVHRDRGIARDLIARAVAAGCTALVVTADVPLPGVRHDLHDFKEPLELGNYGHLAGDETRFAEALDGLLDPSVTWDDLAWIRSEARVPVVLKGVLSPEDARLAVEHGVSAVVVSNHGGRQLDRSPASIDALPRVVEAVADRAEVYLDSGVRSGLDALVALSLGARAVFIGRPYLYALALGGHAGVADLLRVLRGELATALALAGVTSVEHVRNAEVQLADTGKPCRPVTSPLSP